MKTEAKVGAMLPQPRNARNHQKLEKARNDPPLEPSGRAWPCPQLGFGPLASSTERRGVCPLTLPAVCFVPVALANQWIVTRLQLEPEGLP